MRSSIVAVLFLVSLARASLAVPFGGYGKSVISSGHRGHHGYPFGWWYSGGSGGHGNFGGFGPAQYKNSYIAIADKYLDNDGQNYINDGFGTHGEGYSGHDGPEYGPGDFQGGQVPIYKK